MHSKTRSRPPAHPRSDGLARGADVPRSGPRRVGMSGERDDDAGASAILTARARARASTLAPSLRDERAHLADRVSPRVSLALTSTLRASPSPTPLAAGADAGGKVRVAVRCRPFNAREAQLGSPCVLRMNGRDTTITNPVTGAETTFTFDYSYWSHDRDSLPPDAPFATQRVVFDDLGKDVLENAWAGYNVCLFAYGQTGSGKSYSMVGPPDGGGEDDEGIVPRACREIFARFAEAKARGVTGRVEVTMIEIHNERVRDLLDPDAGSGGTTSLRVRTHPVEGPYVEGLTPCAVRDYDEIRALMDRGAKARTTAATAMNATSSRAHTVTELRVRRSEPDGSEISSRVSLVDLAGSERSDATGATGARLKEGAAINKSLSALGNCISALADGDGGKSGARMVPYRDSTLTLLLRESLGGNSRTVMIAALSPAAVNYEETLGTLRFADRARNIVSSATVNREMRERTRPGSARAWDEKLRNTENAMSTDMDAARRRVVDREANALRDAAGMDALPPALEEALERAIRTVAEANALTEEFDVGVRFKPTLVDAQRAALRIRAPATDDDVDHELEVAIDVTWDDTGRKSNWPTATLEARVEEWREVYCHWVEGELFTSEAADAISSSAAAEASSEMRKLGTAELRTEPLAYFLDTETAYPAIVGPDGERRGTLEVSAVPCAKDGAPLGESAAVDDPRDALGKPLHFLVRIKRATGLPRTAIGTRDDPAPTDVATPRPTTGAVTATLRVRYHGRLGPGWGTVHATPPVPVVAVHESKGSARFRGFRGGGGGGTVGGAAAALRYERTHSCPSVTSEILASLEEGRITFDVYVQQDGGAAAGAPPSVARPSTADITRSRRRAREIEPPSLLPPERAPEPPPPEPRAAELAPVEEGNENEARDSDARSISSSDASMASGSDDAFDRDAYEEYWDAEEAKHAAAMRSPFKIYPGWGGEAPGEGGDADEDEDEDADEDESDSDSEDEGAPARTGSVSEGIRFTNEGDVLSEELGATALSTPPRSPVPVSRAPGASTPRAPSNTPSTPAGCATPSSMSPLRLLLSPFASTRVADSGVIEVRPSSRQPRKLASESAPAAVVEPQPRKPPSAGLGGGSAMGGGGGR